jgi:hypothetical protein
MTDLESSVARFVEHKLAIGRGYHSEEVELRLLVHFTASTALITSLASRAPWSMTSWPASPRPARAASTLLRDGLVSGLLQWAVTNELIETSPLRARRGGQVRVPFLFDIGQARRLLDDAGALPNNPRALQRGPVYGPSSLAGPGTPAPLPGGGQAWRLTAGCSPSRAPDLTVRFPV